MAIVEVTMTDDGGTPNGGDDTSEVKTFNVSYSDVIFENGFEQVGNFKVLQYLNKVAADVTSQEAGNGFVDYPYWL